MRLRSFTLMFFLLLGTLAGAQQIRDLDIKAVLLKDGSAEITQVWDVLVTDGTEWYVPVGNLGKMQITDFSVSENGRPFYYEGDSWDIHRSLEEKAGRCGIVRKRSDAVELCWGQGSIGNHQWTASFTVTGLVQSLQDKDAFNFMFVNPGLVAPPRHVKVTIRNATGGPEWTTDNTLVWGFGCPGEINVIDGEIIAESTEPLAYDNKLIAMVAFDKGLFEPAVSRDISFSEMQDKALEGSSYGEGDESFKHFLWLMLACLLSGGALILWVAIAYATGNKYKKSLFGTRKITEWFREAPLEGNLFASDYVLENSSRFGITTPNSQNLIGAFFLRWILEGTVRVEPDPKKPKRVNLAFGDAPEITDDVERALYEMAREASGANLLLESGEFEKWSEKNFRKFTAWPERAKARGRNILHTKGYLTGLPSKEEGAREMRHVIEFKNFLTDFTLSKERGAVEVKLWKDYLVFAQLFGIADKVAAQFERLYPTEFKEYAQQTVGMDIPYMMRTIRMTNNMSSSAVNRAVQRYQTGSIKGLGGGMYIGGGGGFSGGGFGGGSR